MDHDALVHQFDAANADVSALRDDVLIALPDPDVAWLSEWLSDTASIFRLFKRHKSIRPLALQEIRSILIWRVRVLRPILLLPNAALLHCLPPPITDSYGRPLVFLKLASLRALPCPVKDTLLQEVERLRLHLRYIRDHHAYTRSFPLQYLLLLDLDGISLQNFNLDLCSWILSDIIPRYPGMLAAVFLLNYSWIHSGAWSLAKRILPSSIIARVFFPSKAQLLSHCSAANLPAEYGGLLPTLDQIDDTLRFPYQTQHLPPALPHPSSPALPALDVENPLSPSSPHPSSPGPGPPLNSTLHRAPSTIALPPLSSQNPFFGYPAVASASNPHRIRHVQRGPYELVRTLAVLWWRRWGRWVWTSVCVTVCVWVLRLRRARARTRVMGGTMTTGASVATLKALLERIWTSRSVPPVQT